MSHHHPAGPGSGRGNHHLNPNLPYYLYHKLLMHQQQQQQQKQYAQQHAQPRPRVPLSNEHHGRGSPGLHHRAQEPQPSQPGRTFSLNKSPSDVQSSNIEIMRNHPNSSMYHAPGKFHPPAYSPDQPLRDARQEEARRAQEQVKKHFEDSFRFAQRKTTQNLFPVSKHQETNPGRSAHLGTPPSPAPPNKGRYHNITHASPRPTPPFQGLHGLKKSSLPGLPQGQYMFGPGDPRNYYSHVGLLPARPREPLLPKPRQSIRPLYPSSPNQPGKSNYPYLPPSNNRAKVRNPAPPQIYGNPSIYPSSSTTARMYDFNLEARRPSLTSHVATRPTHTPPLPSPTHCLNLPRPEIRIAELISYYMYSNAQNGPSYNQVLASSAQSIPMPEYQTQPLDLGVKRKLGLKPTESERKKVKNHAERAVVPPEIDSVDSASDKQNKSSPPLGESDDDESAKECSMKDQASSSPAKERGRESRELGASPVKGDHVISAA